MPVAGVVAVSLPASVGRLVVRAYPVGGDAYLSLTDGAGGSDAVRMPLPAGVWTTLPKGTGKLLWMGGSASSVVVVTEPLRA